MLIVVVPLVRKVAVSALATAVVEPGIIGSTVLQLSVPPATTQSALAGAAFQVALAAKRLDAGRRPRLRATAVMRDLFFKEVFIVSLRDRL